MTPDTELQEAAVPTSTPPTTPATPTKPPVTRGRRRAFTIFLALLACIAVGGLFYWLHARGFEETDDAQVDAHLNPVTSRVDGTIVHVYVEDNQMVKAGDPLIDLDERDMQASLDGALAQLTQARSMVIAQRPNVPIIDLQNSTSINSGESDVANAKASLSAAERDQDSSTAKLAEAEANNARAQADLERYKILIAKEEVSQQEYDQIAATAKAQAATVMANQASLDSSEQVVAGRRAQLEQTQSRLNQFTRNAPRQIAVQRATLASQQASQRNSEAQVERARLNLSYCRIVASVGGIVTQRSGEVGAHISAGQQVMQIAQIGDLWVTANFKETQLRGIRPQQETTIHVDAIDRDFAGYVETIGGSTGAVASVLPPENATGNFVKVVQRIPVRIRFKPDQNGLERLRPGMSVEPRVRIRE